jgi:hypothetical protein
MASLTRSQLKTSSNNTYDTNGVGGITATEVRTFNDDLIDSLITNDLTGGMSVATASLALTASSVASGVLTPLNQFTASATIRLNNLETTSASVNISIANLNGATGSYAISSSVAAVDAAQQQQINSLIAASSSYANSASFAASQLVQDGRLNNLETTSASLLIETANLETFSASALISINALNTNSASVNTSITNINSATQSLQSQLNTIGGQTGSYITESETGSFAITGSNIFIGNQTITGSLLVSGSDVNFRIIGNSALNPSFGLSGIEATITATDIIMTVQGDVKINNNVSGRGLQLTGGDPTIGLRDTSAPNNPFIGLTNKNNRLEIIDSTSTIATMNTASFNIPSASFTASLQQGYAWVGDSTGKTVTVATSSFGGTTDLTSLNSFTASANQRIGSLEAATSSYVTETESGSFLLTASFDNGTRNLTFTKGNNTTFAVNIPDVSGSTGNFVTTSSFNAYTQSTDNRLNNIESTTASLLIETQNLELFSASALVSITNLNASSASQQVSIDALNTFTASQSTASLVTSITNLNTFSASALVSITNINSATQSLQAQLTTIGGQSGSWITESETSSFARTNVDNNFSVNQTFTNITAVSASITYLTTLYETASVIYSSGSNQLGDELTDIQTLSGSVKVQGSLTVNGTPVLTSSVDISGLTTTASFNSYTQSNNQRVSSLETNSASVNTSVSNINTFTQSANISINALNAATSSYATSAITASSLITASVNLNTITFTKGDASTFAITVNTGSGGGGTTDTGSLMVTGSVAGNVLTFTKGNASTFTLTVATGSGGGTTDITALNAFTASQYISNSFFATTGSNAFSGSNTFNGNFSIITDPNVSNVIISASADNNNDRKVLSVLNGTAIFPNSGSNFQYDGIAIGARSGSNTSAAVAEFAVDYNNGPSLFWTPNRSDSANNNRIRFTSLNNVTQSVQVSTGLFQLFNNGSRDIADLGKVISFPIVPGTDGQYLRLVDSNGTVGFSTFSSGSFATTGSNTFTGNQLIDKNGGEFQITDPSNPTRGTTAIGISGASGGLIFKQSGSVLIEGVSGNKNLTFYGTGSFVKGIAISDNDFVAGATIRYDTTNDVIIIEKDGSFKPSLNIEGGLTASLEQGYVWVGNASGRTVTVATSSFGGGGSIDTGSFATTGSNTFIGNQIITGNVTISGSATSDLTVVGQIYVSSSATGGTTQPRIIVSGSGGQSNINRNSITTTNGTDTAGIFPSTVFSSDVATQDEIGFTIDPSVFGITGWSTGPAIYVNNDALDTYAAVFGFQNKANLTDGRVAVLTPLSASAGFTASLQNGFAWVGNSLGQNTQVATSSFGGGGTINTGSFATTGSNTFTGDQTLIDNAGNFFTISDASGSMMLVAKGFTSASAHISASSAGIGNFIFKTNSNTPDTIISGSGNIFTNGAAATAGFKRYIGGSNNIYNTTSLPQLSGSMQFSPTFSNNYFAGGMTMRGPVSSSIWTIAGNSNNGTINIGSSATLHAEKLTAGLTMTGNSIAGTLSIIANQTALTGSTTTINNNNINGTVTLNLSSSALTFTGNTINDTGFTLTNQFSSSSVGLGLPTANANTIAGANNSFLMTGSQLTSSLNFGMSFNQNFVFGNANTLFSNASNARVSGSNNYTATVATGLLGQRLIVSASSNTNDASSFGSVFVGRNNANDGIRNKTSDIVFAVGTGVSSSADTRKTGFLIDSGSNSYFEGTLNVSGSTTMTGSLYIQSGSWIPSATGSSLLTWNSATGQIGQSSVATLISSSFSVGAFNSTITQSGSAAVSQSMTFNNTDISNGVSIVSNSQITLANNGTYNIQFSAQVLAGTGADTIWIWLKKNGTNVSNTATKLVLRNNEADVAAWNFVVPAVATDYFELVWQSLDGHATLLTEAASGNYPAIPSIIVTVTQVE